ncbi:MAG: hypothetical protein QM280_04355, partial [Bacteroidota bacterium]|nr:hypothetical protein [Bacteroidota bacterium]
LTAGHQDYRDMLRQGTARFEVFGMLAKAMCDTLLEPNPTATENSVDVRLGEDSECGTNWLHVFSVTAANFSYCKSDGDVCSYQAEGRYDEPRLTAFREVLTTQQFTGGIFEAGNFTCNVVWMPYINLDNNKVNQNIPAIFVSQLIENALDFINTVLGYPITYNAATDLYFKDPASKYFNAVITNFVVGGVDWLSSLFPTAHEGEILFNQPVWTLRQLLDNLTTHYNFTWRLIDNGGTFELHIRERNTWNSTPLFDVQNVVSQLNGELCSDGETEGVYSRIEINQAQASIDTAANRPRYYYSELETFVQVSNIHQVEALTIQDPFTGTTINEDGTRLGIEFIDRLVPGNWWYFIIPARSSGGFLLVNADRDNDPNTPRILIPDAGQLATNYDIPSGTYTDIVCESRAATVAETTLLGTYGYVWWVGGATLRNWHEWIDSDMNALAAVGDENRWQQFALYDPVTQQFLGRNMELTLCYSCGLMGLLGMYEGQTPTIDYAVTAYEQHFGSAVSTFTAYIDTITVTVGKEIKIKLRF